MKYLSKIPSCSLHNRLRESMRSGQGALISSLREQNGQYSCTSSTELKQMELDFRPECIRVTSLNSLKSNVNDRLCTIQVKICEISDEIAVMFEENQFKRAQKMKKNVVIGNATDALEMNIWESQFNQIVLGDSYHIRLVKIRIFNNQISLTATTDTTYVIKKIAY
jgi:hypothetical protein